MKILNMVFNMSITGSIMFFIFLLFKPITRKHFNSFWHYKILILILIFFIIPVDNFIELPTIDSMPNISNLEIGESRVTENIKTREDTNIIEKDINIEKEMPEHAVEIEDKVTDKDINQIKTKYRI